MSINANDILAVTKSVTKEWTKQRKSEERSNRSRSSREYMYSARVNFTDVAEDIIPDAYDHASGGGKYTVSKRQLYYACREAFRTETGGEISYDYFAGTLLVKFLNQNPDITEDWKITADPRGTLIIPNAAHEVRIPCGTLQIENHLDEVDRAIHWMELDARIDPTWPSLAAGQRYQAVLYIEKEGFGPLFEEAKIAERFEVAVLSCKGQSVVAARKFADYICYVGGGVPLLAVHDFDKSGFEISQRLTTVSDWARSNDRVTYDFENEIDFTDLGLRIEDINQYQLTDEKAKLSGRFNGEVDRIVEDAIGDAQDADIPSRLNKKLRAAMKKNGKAWDQALYGLAVDARDSGEGE